MCSWDEIISNIALTQWHQQNSWSEALNEGQQRTKIYTLLGSSHLYAFKRASPKKKRASLKGQFDTLLLLKEK